MKELGAIKSEIARMSQAALKMLEITHQAFMEHNPDLIALALEQENQLNEQEKSITTELIEFGRGSAKKEERKHATLYTDIVGDLELIGDYCKDILERVQIKIEEKLLFSEDAVKDYNDLYGMAYAALKELAEALARDDLSLIGKVMKKEKHIDSLVDEYRQRHNQRMIKGVCTPMACNMFLNMLDFTAAIYYHAKKITRNLLKTKK
ncbi:MAG: PhoU domain-containing protein [Candidatus Omnitrophota bacterium]|jgi:phosphate:Na+ symporter